MKWQCRFCDKEITDEEAKGFDDEFNTLFKQFDRLFDRVGKSFRSPPVPPEPPKPHYYRNERKLCGECGGYKTRSFHERQPQLVASLAFVCGVVFMCALASIMEWWK